MGSDFDLRTPEPILATREERRRASIAAGRAKRAHNRELLQQRELDRAGPSNPVLAGLKTLLGAIVFLPLYFLMAAVVFSLDEDFGRSAAWIAGILGIALAAFVAYHSPSLLRGFSQQFRGISHTVKRKSETPWATLIVLVLLPLVLLIGFFQMSWR